MRRWGFGKGKPPSLYQKLNDHAHLPPHILERAKLHAQMGDENYASRYLDEAQKIQPNEPVEIQDYPQEPLHQNNDRQTLMDRMSGSDMLGYASVAPFLAAGLGGLLYANSRKKKKR